MAVYLAWSDAAVDVTVPGPWEALHPAADGLVLVASDASLSRVYHELKWSLPDAAALLVVPIEQRPKLARVAAGTRTWLRERLP
ncbi:hypothetical protein SAMN05443575_2210 [Jatrophihabitans endophyticus]|uniref:Uncharacterized protein n=1 Tax=Jatrophihabitans endophyticus TaxID=1206085 RepID=A0A1M5KND7_9ACTN|nr:hypothetical protein [Jatrophihabitans endophyticus]SHG54236.1 hypothetical protein SAMN05443575_2210 [Jatrophihabitans endophyticus]